MRVRLPHWLLAAAHLIAECASGCVAAVPQRWFDESEFEDHIEQLLREVEKSGSGVTGLRPADGEDAAGLWEDSGLHLSSGECAGRHASVLAR